MSATDTAAQLARLARQLVGETGGLTAAEAAKVQSDLAETLGCLAAAWKTMPVAGGGASAAAPATPPAAAAPTPPTALTPPTPVTPVTPVTPATPAAAGGGLKITLGGGSSSGGSAPAPISLGSGAGSAPSAPPPGGRSGLDVARGLTRFKEFVERAQIAVPAADLAFTGKAVSIIEGLPEAERNSGKVAKLLGDCIGFIDKILAESYAEGMEDFIQAGNAVQKEIADFLHVHSIAVVPLPGEGVQAALNAGAEQVETFHAGSKGTPLAVARHGLRVNGSLALKPAVLVSSGETGELAKLMAVAIAALIRPRGGHAAEAKLRAQSIKELRTLAKQLPGADEDKLKQVCQYAINAVHNCNHEKALEAILGKLVDILKAAGYSEIYVGIGQKFDESYSPSKYERRKLSSDKEIGTILGVQQRGFLNRSGVPVQKAIVLVSG